MCEPKCISDLGPTLLEPDFTYLNIRLKEIDKFGRKIPLPKQIIHNFKHDDVTLNRKKKLENLLVKAAVLRRDEKPLLVVPGTMVLLSQKNKLVSVEICGNTVFRMHDPEDGWKILLPVHSELATSMLGKKKGDRVRGSFTLSHHDGETFKLESPKIQMIA